MLSYDHLTVGPLEMLWHVTTWTASVLHTNPFWHVETVKNLTSNTVHFKQQSHDKLAEAASSGLICKPAGSHMLMTVQFRLRPQPALQLIFLCLVLKFSLFWQEDHDPWTDNTSTEKYINNSPSWVAWYKRARGHYVFLLVVVCGILSDKFRVLGNLNTSQEKRTLKRQREKQIPSLRLDNGSRLRLTLYGPRLHIALKCILTNLAECLCFYSKAWKDFNNTYQ